MRARRRDVVVPAFLELRVVLTHTARTSVPQGCTMLIPRCIFASVEYRNYISAERALKFPCEIPRGTLRNRALPTPDLSRYLFLSLLPLAFPHRGNFAVRSSARYSRERRRGESRAQKFHRGLNFPARSRARKRFYFPRPFFAESLIVPNAGAFFGRRSRTRNYRANAKL